MGFITWLQGKKTYVVAVVVAGLQLAVNVGWISPDFYNSVIGFLAGLGLATLRAGVSKTSA